MVEKGGGERSGEGRNRDTLQAEKRGLLDPLFGVNDNKTKPKKNRIDLSELHFEIHI